MVQKPAFLPRSPSPGTGATDSPRVERHCAPPDTMDKTNPDPTQSQPALMGDLLHEVRALGEYRILRRLGEGGMGAVYLGYHEGKDQQVAIKVLGDHLANNQAYVDRFYREAKSGALLNHPNLVRTLNVGQDQTTGLHY